MKLPPSPNVGNIGTPFVAPIRVRDESRSEYVLLGKGAPVKKTIALAALVLYKRCRKLSMVMKITGWEFYRVKDVLLAVEPDIFEKYPIRKAGKPNRLRISISRKEFDWAAEMHQRHVGVLTIAGALGVWSGRLEYWLWKYDRLRPDYKLCRFSAWLGRWQREYEKRGFEREEQSWDDVGDDLYPKRVVEDDEDEIRRVLEEEGL